MELEPLKNLIGQNGMPSTNQREMQPTSLGLNTRKSLLPPLVIPKKNPDEILQNIFLAMEYDTIYKFLEEYQRKKPEWDVFRAKIPELLLVKLGSALKECRENGFIAPFCKDGRIIFHQIKTHLRNRKNTDKCTLCTNNFIDYTCKGSLKHNQFIPCWR